LRRFFLRRRGARFAPAQMLSLKLARNRLRLQSGMRPADGRVRHGKAVGFARPARRF